MARTQKQPEIVTRQSLKAMIDEALAANDERRLGVIVGRALVALFERQTESEQRSNDTAEHNTIGFSGADGKGGTLTAKYFLKNKRLERWQIDRWIRVQERTGYPRICKYARQLNEIAVEKATKTGQE